MNVEFHDLGTVHRFFLMLHHYIVGITMTEGDKIDVEVQELKGSVLRYRLWDGDGPSGEVMGVEYEDIKRLEVY